MTTVTRTRTASWFAEEPLDDGIIRLFEPSVHRWYRGNLFFVPGRTHHLVIDGGMGLQPLRPVLAKRLDRPCLFVATHGHADHIGAAHEFEARLIHPAEAMALEGDLAWSLLDGFRSHEAPVSIRPDAAFEASSFTQVAAPATGFLGEGSVVDLGDRRFRVLELPGHSPGSIGLFDEAAGVLFAGDAIYDGILVDDLKHSNREAYRRTMERLMDLTVRAVHGGHNAGFGRSRMIEIARAYLDGPCR